MTDTGAGSPDHTPPPEEGSPGEGSSDAGGEAARLRRRDLLRAGGLGGGFLLGGGALVRSAGASTPGADVAGGEAPGARAGYVDQGVGQSGHAHGGHAHAGPTHGGHVHDDLEQLGVVRAGYGHGPAPPRDLDDELIAELTHPPAPRAGGRAATRELELAVTAEPWAVAEGATLDAWLYGGRLPGPVIRATEGDRLRLHVPNRTPHAHNLHLHGAHDPQMDGWEPIPAGGTFTYELEARPAGLHPYHCHTPPLAEHVRRGLYGAMIVDPPGGREPAREVMLVLGGFDLDSDGRNELYAFNGICGLYDRHPIRVEVGELVRVYLVNMIEGDPVASFHLHAQTFDVQRSGTGASPHEHTDQVTLAQGDRAVLEFRLPTRGRYMFHPHQHHMAERGAMGWFTAV